MTEDVKEAPEEVVLEPSLTVFLYLLARSGLPMHSLEAMVSKACDQVLQIQDGPILAWARAAAEKLTPAELEPEPEPYAFGQHGLGLDEEKPDAG